MNRVLAPWPVAAFLIACSGPTQLIVVVDTNLEAPVEIDTVEVIVVAPDGVQTVTPQSVGALGDPVFPLTLGVTPEMGRLGPISVAAVGRRAGAEVVRVTATALTLIAGETRVLTLLLLRSCVGRTCLAGQTCGPGGCSSAAGDVAALPTWDGQPPPFDDSDRCLAMPWDVDGDGQGDEGCGGMDCDDAEPLAFAGAVEQCNSIDDNCDGVIDEECSCTPIGRVEDCTTSCASTGRHTCGMGGWSPCAPPAETCNGVDDDCNGLTDEGFDYVASAPVNVTNDLVDPGETSNEPAIAWGSDRLGLAWDDNIAGDGIHFVPITNAGAFMGTPIAIGVGRTPAVAFGGGVFAVTFWNREAVGTATPDRVMFRILDSGGVPLIDAVQLTDDADQDPRPRIVWDGSAFVVSYWDDSLFFHRLGPDGAELGARFTVPSGAPDRADLAFDGRIYAFGWDRGGSVYFTRGSETAGFPIDATLVAGGVFAERTGMAWTGSGYILAWRTSSGPPRISSMALDATGIPTGFPLELSATGAARRIAEYPNRPYVDVTEAPGQVLVVWADARDGDVGLYAARLAPDGSILQSPLRLSAPPPVLGDFPSAAWDGGGFVVTWEEQVPFPRSEVFLNRLACP